MASFEGPAPTGEQQAGLAPATTQGLPEVPPLTPERSRQELEKLAALITSNETLNFLEPRVRRCQENGGADMPMLLSFYRLISQALAEELSAQRERLQASQSALAQARQSSAQMQMQAAMEEASQAVQMVARGEASSATAASSGGVASDEAIAKLEQAEKQSERLLQDMQNMRNRAKIDVDVKVFKEVEKFSQSLIPALDAFNQAMPALKSTSDISSVVTGVTMIYEQLLDSLAKAGLTRMKVIGEKFDPRYHEAIGEVPTSDVPDEHVYDELQPGYMLGERMIRAAMVRLARNDGPPPAQAAAPPAPAQPAGEAEVASAASAPAQAVAPQAAPPQAAPPSPETPPAAVQPAASAAPDPFPPAPPPATTEVASPAAWSHEETSPSDPNQ
jgi:molecular chaperone GrpE